MITEKRRQDIIKLTIENDGISTKELANLLNVSTMTIIRDIKILVKEGSIKATRGGVIPADKDNKEKNQFYDAYNDKRRTYLYEKKKIADYCVKTFVENNSVIAIEGGSTASLMIKKLLYKDKLTVISNGFFTLEEAYKSLHSNAKLISTGGILTSPYLSFLGPDAESFFVGKRVDAAFISSVGFDLDTGVAMDSSAEEARVKSSMLHAAERKVLLMDSSKIGQRSIVKLVEARDITDFVTTSNISNEDKKSLEGLFPNLHIIE